MKVDATIWVSNGGSRYIAKPRKRSLFVGTSGLVGVILSLEEQPADASKKYQRSERVELSIESADRLIVELQEVVRDLRRWQSRQ